MKVLKVVIVCITAFLYGCSQEDTQVESTPINSPTQVVFFGHQSVGANIMDGVRDLTGDEHNIHDVYIGSNRDPVSKINDFEYKLDQLITSSGQHVDIAMMKFCFVDIPNKTLTVEQVFEEYVAMVNRVQRTYPGIQIVHMTVPLTSAPTGLKAWTKNMVKRILGRPVYNATLNMSRNQFNVMLRNQFHNEPIFDIAALESQNGQYRENDTAALFPAYTDDGGHLNNKGRRFIAAQFLKLVTKND